MEMNIIKKITDWLHPSSKLSTEEIAEKAREIARLSAEAREKKRQEIEKNKNELSLAPLIDIDLDKLNACYVELDQKKPEWTLELLMALEWKRFEAICKEYLSIKNYDARLTETGADGGVNIKIYNGQKVSTFVQCKAWQTKIEITELQEFYGIMASAEITQGIFFTTSSFSQEAIEFKQRKNITLIDGQDLLNRIKNLKELEQRKLYELAIAGDDTTPAHTRQHPAV